MGTAAEGCFWASFQVLGREQGYWGPGPLPSPLDLASSWAGTTGISLPKFKPQVLEVTSSCPLSLLWNLNNLNCASVSYLKMGDESIQWLEQEEQ